MRHGFFFLFVLFLSCVSFSCSKVSNNINDLSRECNIPLESLDHSDTYLKFVSSDGLYEKNDIDAFNADTRQAIKLSQGNCLALGAFQDHQNILVRKKSTQEGLLIRSSDFSIALTTNRLVHLPLETFRYKPVTSMCNVPVYLKEDVFQFPLEIATPLHGYKVRFEVLDERDRLVFRQEFMAGAKQENQIDVLTSSLEEAKYRAKIQLTELFSIAEAEFSFDCEFIVDRTASKIVFERSDRKIINQEQDSFLAFQPGEVLKLDINDDMLSKTTIYYCILPYKSNDTDCDFNPLLDSTFTVPSYGKWDLFLYTLDSSGNQSQIEQIKFVAFNQAAVNEILSIVTSAEILRNSGRYLQAISKSLLAFQKYASLKTDLEKNFIGSKLKKLIYEGANGLFLTDEMRDAYRQKGGILLGWLDSFTYIKRKTVAEVDQLIIRDLRRQSQGIVINLHEYINDSFSYSIEMCGGSERYLILRKPGSVGRFDVKSNRVNFQDFDAKPHVGSFHFTSKCDQIVFDLLYVEERSTQTAIWEPKQNKIHVDEKKKVIPLLLKNKTILIELNEETNKIFNYESKDELLGNVEEIEAISPCSEYLVVRATTGESVVYDSSLQKIFNLKNKKDRVVFAASCETISFVNKYDIFETYSLTDGRKIGGSIVRIPSIAKSFSVGRNYIAAIIEGQSNEVTIWSIDAKQRESLYVRNGQFKHVELNEHDLFIIGASNGYEFYDANNPLLSPVRTYEGTTNGLAVISENQFLYKSYSLDQRNYPEFQIHEKMILLDRTTNERKDIELPTAYTFDARPVVGQVMHANTIEVQKTTDGKQQVGVVVNRGNVRIYEDTSFENFTDYPVSNGWLLDIDLHSDGRSFIAAGRDGNVYMHNGKETFVLFEVPACSEIEMAGTQHYPVHVKFIEDLDRIIVSDDCGRLHRFDRLAYYLDVGYRYARPHKTVSAHVGDARFTLNKQDNMIASVGYGGKANFWSPDLEFLDEIDLQATNDHESRGVSLSFDEAGENLYIGSYDGSWTKYDLTSKEQLKIQFGQPYFGAIFLELFPGDPSAMITSDGSEVLIWDLNMERFTKKMCDFLTPRLHLLDDITEEERQACEKLMQ
ncbi:MAG: hypothetical protein ACOH5I_21770 [Oligoflexus sp.]